MVFTPAQVADQRNSFRELLEDSYARRQLVHLPAGSNVPLLRSRLWVVVRGMVKLCASSVQGDALMLGLAGPNEPFGDPLSSQPTAEATTLVASDLLCLSGDEILGAPHLAIGLLQGLAARYRQSEAMLALVGLRRIEDRLRGFLELMAEDYGQPCEQGLRLPVRLTHQDLAGALSTTRVTITRVLGDLRSSGWLLLGDDRHFVLAHQPLR